MKNVCFEKIDDIGIPMEADMDKLIKAESEKVKKPKPKGK